MDAMTPLINGGLLALFTVVLAWLGKGRFATIDRRFDRIEEQMNRRFEQVDARIERLSGEIASVRTDITQLALAIGTRPHAG